MTKQSPHVAEPLGASEQPSKTVPSQLPGSGSISPLEGAKLVVQLARGLAWPILIFGLLVAYRAEFRSIANSLAQKFSQADKVGLGGLSFEIQKEVTASGNSQLAATIGHLSRAAVQQLLDTPLGHSSVDSGYGSSVNGKRTDGKCVPNSVRLRAFEELEEEGLVKSDVATFWRLFITLPFEAVQPPYSDSRLLCFLQTRDLSPDELSRLMQSAGVELTDKGIKAKQAIVKVVSEQLR